jgi:hypothetical protein
MPGAKSMGKTPMVEVSAADEVLDRIAGIELHRQAIEKDAGLAAACSSALRKLHELLEHEQETLQLHGSGAGHQANVNAAMAEVERVKKLAVATGQGPPHKNTDHAGLRQVSRQKLWQNAQRTPARNKGRRTMGRGGGR